ncbi:MAG TPA: T9SS type A sorting domain-containing protein [Rubricoccaceae bacterium]|jgi:hypothetical protein
MRLAPLFALIVFTSAVHAQQCVPDPTPPESYYPLGVGDEWIYRIESDPAMGFVQRRVLREETVGGQTYAVDQTCRVPAAGGAATCEPERRVRFDGASSILARQPDGSEQAVLTRLAAGLTRGPLYPEACMVDLGTQVRIGITDYSVPQIKAEYAIDFGPPALAAGLGETFFQRVESNSYVFGRLAYARVGGVQYGIRPAVPGPDPTPAEAYAPLAVGNQWEYRLYSQGGPTTGYRRETVVRDTLIGGNTWFVRRDQTFSTAHQRTSDARRLVRFDAAAANLFERTASGIVLQRYPCRLDIDLTGDGFPSCSIGITYSKRPDTVLGVSTTRLSFGYDFGTTQLAASLGLVLTVDEGTWTELVYARMATQTVGAPVDALPFAPDPTPPADYYPLEVGNEWIYRYTEQSVNGTGDAYVRRRMLREEAVGGQTYAVDQECVYDNLAAATTWTCEPERLVRFDPATTNVVIGGVGGTESVFICELGADFGAVRACAPSGGGAGRWVDLGLGPVLIGGQAVPVARVKQETSLANVPPPVYIAGIGRGPMPAGPFRTSSFEFARVRGVEYGVRPVAGESGAPVAAAFALAASPNPTAGPLALAFTLPEAQTVTAEAFDALGRRVWQTTAALGAGAQTLTVDASAWAPGVYVVRAIAGQASATARVVRQ